MHAELVHVLHAMKFTSKNYMQKTKSSEMIFASTLVYAYIRSNVGAGIAHNQYTAISHQTGTAITC
jgi:hypothetical protein